MKSKRNKQQSHRPETKGIISEKAPAQQRPPEASRSTPRAIDLLHANAKLQAKRSGLSRLAKEVQLPNSTTHRILSVLFTTISGQLPMNIDRFSVNDGIRENTCNTVTLIEKKK